MMRTMSSAAWRQFRSSGKSDWPDGGGQAGGTEETPKHKSRRPHLVR